jgi:hypothetical protein
VYVQGHVHARPPSCRVPSSRTKQSNQENKKKKEKTTPFLSSSSRRHFLSSIHFLRRSPPNPTNPLHRTHPNTSATRRWISPAQDDDPPSSCNDKPASSALHLVMAC